MLFKPSTRCLGSNHKASEAMELIAARNCLRIHHYNKRPRIYEMKQNKFTFLASNGDAHLAAALLVLSW